MSGLSLPKAAAIGAETFIVNQGLGPLQVYMGQISMALLEGHRADFAVHPTEDWIAWQRRPLWRRLLDWLRGSKPPPAGEWRLERIAPVGDRA